MPKDPRLLALRRQLAAALVQSLGPDSQYVVAPSFGIRQPRMSELENGNVRRCSLEWLIDRVYRVGGTVTISVTVPDARREWRRVRTQARRSASGPAGGAR